jgi:integrase/recombinase XerD
VSAVAGFSVRRVVDGPAAFAVVDLDGRPVPELGAFLRDLAERDRSAYTQRAYALGLADFFGWLAARGLALEAADRSVVSAYIADYRAGEKGGATRVDVARIGRVDGRTRKPAPALERQPATVNHRLAVLASFFAFVIGRDRERGAGVWLGAENPVPRASGGMEGSHGMPGRDAPRRGRRGELRQRVPRRLPRHLEPGLAEELIEAAGSWRDKALVMLLWRTGQRIGDWSPAHGRHGVLGMALADLDRRTCSVVVRLKGARDEHRVPVAEEFWPLFSRYLAEERGFGDPGAPAWLARGGRALSYATFESSLRYLGGKVGARVNAHMFRHTLAQVLVDSCGLKVAQEVLGHRHLSTTADAYTRVDQAALVRALEHANAAVDRAARVASERGGAADGEGGYVFGYDAATLVALESLAVDEHPDQGRPR